MPENNIVTNTPASSQKKTDSKRYLAALFELFKIIIIALIIVFPIRYFLFQPFIVKGESMVPNFASGDYLIVDEISYRFRDPGRGDVVVLKYPLDDSQKFIKRIIGLPGETIDIKDRVVAISKEGNTLIIDESKYLLDYGQTDGDVHITLGNNEYFVLGDNRQFSYDSRRWGALPREDIIGRVVLRVFPINKMSYIAEPTY